MKKTLMGALLAALLAGGLAAAEGRTDTIQALRYGTQDARDKALDEVAAGRAQDAGPALLALLAAGGNVPGERVKVIRGLGVVREKKAVKPLLAVLDARLGPAPSAETRQAVAEALGDIGAPAAAPALTGLLADNDAGVRAAAADALGVCGNRASVETLGQALADTTPSVQLAAASALGRLGFADALPRLKALFSSGDKRLERQAALAIGSLRSAEASAFLNEELEDEDPYLRAFSAEALALRPRDRAGERTLIARLEDPVYAVRVRAAEALGAWRSDPAVPALIKALRSSLPTLRLAAVKALGEIRSTAARAPLEYLRDQDSEDRIRSAAREALKGLR